MADFNVTIDDEEYVVNASSERAARKIARATHETRLYALPFALLQRVAYREVTLERAEQIHAGMTVPA